MAEVSACGSTNTAPCYTNEDLVKYENKGDVVLKVTPSTLSSSLSEQQITTLHQNITSLGCMTSVSKNFPSDNQ